MLLGTSELKRIWKYTFLCVWIKYANLITYFAKSLANSFHFCQRFANVYCGLVVLRIIAGSVPSLTKASVLCWCMWHSLCTFSTQLNVRIAPGWFSYIYKKNIYATEIQRKCILRSGPHAIFLTSLVDLSCVIRNHYTHFMSWLIRGC